LLQAFYTIRSERRLMEQLDYNLLYIGNAMTENRHGLVVETELGGASATIER
jgi:hypothetical protein